MMVWLAIEELAPAGRAGNIAGSRCRGAAHYRAGKGRIELGAEELQREKRRLVLVDGGPEVSEKNRIGLD
jgi:hypothetical protein